MPHTSPSAKKSATSSKKPAAGVKKVRNVLKRACKQERMTSEPVLSCKVAGLLKGRRDKSRLEKHLKAIEKHRQKYKRRIAEARRKAGKGDASEVHAIPAHKAKVTEAVGEHATTVHMVQSYPKHQLLWDFSAGTGIDQVWAVGMPNPTEYVIVEAKGPGATLSTAAAKGDQMSKMWVRNSLNEVLNSSKSSDDEKAHARAMLRAMAKGPPPKVKGVVVEAIKGGGAKEVGCPDKGIYHKGK